MREERTSLQVRAGTPSELRHLDPDMGDLIELGLPRRLKWRLACGKLAESAATVAWRQRGVHESDKHEEKGSTSLGKSASV